jgi:hypothetical protein
VPYPYYTVNEVATIFSMSDDLVRRLFRNGRQGPVLEICNRRPGRRTYRIVLIPYGTVMCFITRFTKEATVDGSTERRASSLQLTA